MEIILNSLKALFSNTMLVSAMAAWFLAQMIKIFTGIGQWREMSLRNILFGTGGMPSSHSATVMALTVSSAFQYGLGSPYFAICTILSIIVMIDASGVRYETGKQAIVLNKITKEIFSGDPELMNMGLKELVGHTPLQVLVGALLGVGVGVLLSLIML